MSEPPLVTVICATRNAREAVRLTLSSFHRHTSEPHAVVVADNGSTDGTLDDLRAIPWLTVIPWPERRALKGADEDEATLAGHAATLDWLAARVRTPFLLTLDSDVEFLAGGWLSEMLALMEQESLVGLGEYEPGVSLGGRGTAAGPHGYRPRLAPYALLLRTQAFRDLRVSFRGFVRIEDPEETRRWLARPVTDWMEADELADYRTMTIYSTGARLLERLVEAGARWSSLPDSIARKLLHLRHMSLVPLTFDQSSERSPVTTAGRARASYADRLAYVRNRLRLYSSPSRTSPWTTAGDLAASDPCNPP